MRAQLPMESVPSKKQQQRLFSLHKLPCPANKRSFGHIKVKYAVPLGMQPKFFLQYIFENMYAVL
jgi:hypothetical protein